MIHRRDTIKCTALALLGAASTHRPACAQNGLHLFRNDMVHEIAITVATPDWVTAVEETYGVPGAAVFATVTIDGEVVDSVGVSTKGESSYITFMGIEPPKYPFVLDFNHYDPARRYDGVRSVNLNNGALDASYLHDALASRVFHHLGIPAPRSGFAHVTMNGTDLGLYGLGERVNKSFLGEHYDDNDGDLWKPYICDWSYYGSDPDVYTWSIELKQDADGTAMQRLIRMFEAISLAAVPDVDDTLEAYLHMDEVLTVLAANVAMQAGDNASVHNWWLYRETPDDRYHYIPWDYNLSFDHVSDSAFHEITTWYYGYFPEPNWWGSTRLGQAIMLNPDLKARFYDKLCMVRNTVFRAEHLAAFVDSAHALLQPYAWADQVDLVTPGQFDSAYYADRHLYSNIYFLYDAWGVQPFIEQQGALIDSVLQARGVSCGTVGVNAPDRPLVGPGVYPDPNEGSFRITWPGHVVARCTLLDALGRVAWTGVLTGEGTDVQVLRASPGTYVLHLTDGAEQRSVRVVITR